MSGHYNVLIIGAGTAGIMVAAQLSRQKIKGIAIIDPADTHYYQPAWTLVGAGTFNFKKTAKPMASLIPKGVTWIKDKVQAFNAKENSITTADKTTYSYNYLVVAPGLVMAPQLIEGLPEALEQGIACSIYTNPEHTWKTLKNFKGGNAVFTQPSTPIKCGGAPQKIAYLAAHYFKKQQLLNNTNVVFATPGSVIFGVKHIRETLENVIKRYGIIFKPFYAPYKIDANKKLIYFKYTNPNKPLDTLELNTALGEKLPAQKADIIEMPFDMLHIAQPQRAPDFIEKSDLCNANGWLDVDQFTLQHKKYANVLGLGDVAALPTAKTGAAIRKQVPVVVDNIKTLMASNKIGNLVYNGYSSCPLVTAYGKMVLAEFDYEGNFTPDPKLKQMLVFNSAKEHWRLWMLKKYGLPYLYWNKMLKGKNV